MDLLLFSEKEVEPDEKTAMPCGSQTSVRLKQAPPFCMEDGDGDAEDAEDEEEDDEGESPVFSPLPSSS